MNTRTQKRGLPTVLKARHHVGDLMDALFLPELVLVEDSYDDEIMSLRGITESGIPCRVTVRRDGDEALAHLLGNQSPLPALIVLDYKLPKHDGLEILTLLRRNPATRYIPVVIVSGTNTGDALTECYRVGANSCVAKPDDPKEYVNLIASITRYWLIVNQASPFGGDLRYEA